MSKKIHGVVLEECRRWDCQLSDNCDRIACGYVYIEGRPDRIPACDRCMRSVSSDFTVANTDSEKTEKHSEPQRGTFTV